MILLETERLIIEKASLNDTTFFFELLNSPNYLEFIGDKNIKSLEDASNYIQESLINSYEKNGFGFYKLSIKSNQQFIGAIGFFQRDYLDFPDIGYAILPQNEGNGYVSEAAKAVFEYGKNKLKLKTIVGITTEDNIGSQKILTKIGLTLKNKIKVKDEELLYYST